jgi:PAS domain S-box-containing protein
MRLSLKTKFTLATSVLVLAVVTGVSCLYIARLTKQVLRQAEDRARFVAQQVYEACNQALKDAALRDEAPSTSSHADVRAYIRNTFDNSSTLNSIIESAVGNSQTIYEITITDKDGIALVSSDSSLRDEKVPRRPEVTSFAEHTSFFDQLRTLYGPPQTYDYSYAFMVAGSHFGDIRIGLSSVFIRNEISPGLESALVYALGSVLLSTILAFVVSSITLAPIDRISAQLDRISAGESDLLPVVKHGDELGVVSTKIAGIGKQLRDVREIFSTLRGNVEQMMSGFEDGYLLFNGEGRAVLVSKSVEKFVGGRAGELHGRRAGEIFPANHPARRALRFEGDVIQPAEETEVTLQDAGGTRRIGLSAQAIREAGKRMGTLVTLRDVESRERIGDQLQVSERLAALGRVTAGVAHEVKNPLNSMRLWLEVLKANMPVELEPQQAVKMLDNEIDRLDRAVKTFLNFTRPVELRLEETDLRVLLEEVIDAGRPSINKSGVELRVELPSEFPPVMVDRQLIHQGVLNLILNACEFTERGGKITLGLRQNGESAVISVADSGKGISAEDQKKIFQLFFTTRPGGTGIGLANTFRFVQLHNGRIEFDSQAGRGTTFRVELPLARSVELPAGKIRDFSQPFAEEKR